MQELNTDFSKICISPKPSGTPMGKLPLPVGKKLDHQARQNIFTINFTTAFANTSSSYNSTLEKCQHSHHLKRLKPKSRKVPTLIEPARVISDPTLGDEGMETPPPNDSSIASISPPIGIRLHSFRRDWLANKSSDHLLNITTDGYILPFTSNQI